MIDIWQYCVTGMVNNAIDHSGGALIAITVERTPASTMIRIHDNGVGIFRKIQAAFGLHDERHAILELSKGKLTTDPEKHSGQRIFFVSRMLDHFRILSGSSFFSHEGDGDDWMLDVCPPEAGTTVEMLLSDNATRTLKEVFDRYSSGEDYGFTKTVVPVNLASHGGGDKLASRSQAKRVLARVELFKTVVFDFAGVDCIGQAFADEIFRVFARSHPEIALYAVGASTDVRRMIAAAAPPSNVLISPPPAQ